MVRKKKAQNAHKKCAKTPDYTLSSNVNKALCPLQTPVWFDAQHFLCCVKIAMKKQCKGYTNVI